MYVEHYASGSLKFVEEYEPKTGNLSKQIKCNSKKGINQEIKYKNDGETIESIIKYEYDPITENRSKLEEYDPKTGELNKLTKYREDGSPYLAEEYDTQIGLRKSVTYIPQN